MTDKTKRNGRATNLAELDDVLEKYFDDSNASLGLAFKPQATDIIISPYSKSGTTWLQQISHGLRTRGSMDFDEISSVVPWIEVAYDMGWDPEAAQSATPRLFKSHANWHNIPKGCRYVCAFRDPLDAVISLYRFFEGWLFEPGSITLDDFVHWRWPREDVGTGGYWYHLISWWEQRDNEDVLLLCYEDMKADLPGTVRQIASFMDIELDEALLDIVVRQSSRDFMLAHKHQFDEHPMREIGDKRAGLPPPIDSSKVTTGTFDKAAYQLSPAIKEELNDIWREQVTPKFGFRDYGKLRQALKDVNYRKSE